MLQKQHAFWCLERWKSHSRTSRFQIFLGGEGGGINRDPPRGGGPCGPFSGHSRLLHLQWPLITKVIETPENKHRVGHCLQGGETRYTKKLICEGNVHGINFLGDATGFKLLCYKANSIPKPMCEWKQEKSQHAYWCIVGANTYHEMQVHIALPA